MNPKYVVVDFIVHIIALYIGLYLLMPEILATSDPMSMFAYILVLSAIILALEMFVDWVRERR